MSEPIARPGFFEGQVLAAADLEAVVEHARGESARDRRDLHTPGIATGLVLQGKDQQTSDSPPKKYQEVTLTAGVAIDRTGRQVVLAADTRLDEVAFDEQRVQINDANAWYPVFLRGRDQQAAVPAISAGSCGTSGTTRVTEAAEVSFGSPGQELDFDANVSPEPADGPGDPDGSLVLVGFVQWDKSLQRFKTVALEHDGIRPRYAGALADEVVSRSGVLALRSSAGANQAAVVVDGESGELRFGLQDSGGGVVPVLTVDAQGNITTKGKLSAAASAGNVQVQSGMVTDGVLLPLPPGISPQQVADSTVTLHVHLTPRLPAQPPAAAADWIAVPLECRLDGPTRRVFCMFRWHQLSGGVSFQDLPGACDYLVIATVPPN
jgi:hypothetical protein